MVDRARLAWFGWDGSSGMVQLKRLCLNAAVSQSTEIQKPIVITIRTHVGRVRTNNEDALRFDAAAGLAALADGMGGLAAGEVASNLAIEVMFDELLKAQPVSAAVLKAAVLKSDRAIHLAGLARQLVMGTTLVVWQRLTTSEALVAHVGDSRCYRLRGAVTTLLTRDHSVVQQRLEAGLITASEAWHAPDRHLITQALGLGEPIVVDVQTVETAAGDRFLLCSDGLTDMIEESELVRLCGAERSGAERSGAEPDDASLADALLTAALAAGGRDNVSLIILRL